MQKHRGMKKQGMQGAVWWFGLRLSRIGDCLDSSPGLLHSGSTLWISHLTSLSLGLPILKWGD